MKSFKRFLLGLSLVALLSAFLAPLALAQFATDEKLYLIPAEERIEDDLFIASEEVIINGTVDGDVFIAAGRVVIDGEITGDLYIGGGEVTISGSVGDDILVGTGVLVLDHAQIGGGVMVLAGEVKMDQDTRVGGSVIFATGVLEMGGQVARNLLGSAGLLEISGSVGKDTLSFGEQLRLQSTARLDGNLSYVAEEEPIFAEGSTVLGEVKQLAERPFWRVEGWQSIARATRQFMILAMFLGTLIVGGILLYLFPKETKGVSQKIMERPFMSVFVGVMALIGVPMVIFFLMITVIGLPLAFVMTLLYLLGLCLAKIFIALFFGQSLAHLFNLEKLRPFWIFFMGLLFFVLIKLLAFSLHPALNAFIVIFSHFFAIGGMLLIADEVIAKFKKGKV